LVAAVLGAAALVAIATPAFALPPTITSVSPAFGTWQGGVVVTINGTNFTTVPDTTVNFGTTPGTVTAVTSTKITVTSPANPSTAAGTSVPVTVTNSNGSTGNVTSSVVGVTWTSGSTCLTGATFVAADVGQTVTGGTGLPAGALITAVGAAPCVAGNAVINAPTTAAQSTAVTVTLTLSFTYPSCTFSSQIAGAVLQVTPGSSSIPISCSRLQGSASFVMALVSPVAGVVTPFSVAADESFIMNNSPALPPGKSSDSSGNMSINLPVPAKTTGGNPQSPGGTATSGDATCPPSQNQVNQGELTCAVAVANTGGVNFGNSLLEYPGQPSPQTPTLALSPTGSSSTVLTATGTGWWGAGASTIPAANIRIGCTGTNPCTGGTPAVSSNLTVTGPTYFITCSATTCTGAYSPSRLSGMFDTGGATGTIAIDQPTHEPRPCSAPANCFPGNGPGRTDAATVSSGSATVLDASVQATDTGDPVSGTGIPAGTFVGTVTAGTSFLLSSSSTSQVNVNATANGTSVVIGTTVEATASSTVPAATASGTGYSTWLGNVPNQAIANSGDNPDPNQFWQPAAGVDSTGSLTYTVTLPAATTLSAATETWNPGFAPPTGYTIQTSTNGAGGPFTTQVTVTANNLQTRTDVFPGGQVTGVTNIRLAGITGFVSTPMCGAIGCGWSGIALVKFGWDGHGVVFPQAFSPNTTAFRVESRTTPQFDQPTITTLTAVGVVGTTTYGYKVTAVNDNGETLASTEKTIANGNATLSATNFNALFWTSVPGATSYNVYGRTAGNETFLANVPASSTTCPPDTAPVPPCFSDTGASTPGLGGPPTAGTVESNALNNPANQGFWWQPTSAAAAGASYEVDLGTPTVLSSVTPLWGFFFSAPSAYEIDTSSNGSTWTPQFTTTTNLPLSKSVTDVFPGGQVTASYLRVVINAPFPTAPSLCGCAGLALVQLSWNGVAATGTATPPASTLLPQAYYPTTLPNSATLNTTSTWDVPNMPRSPNNGFFGGPGGRTIGGSTTCCSTTSGSTTITAVSGTPFTAGQMPAGDVGRPVRGDGIPAGDFITAVNSPTSITVNVAATATNSGGVLSLGGGSWWQPAGASGNTGSLTYAVALPNSQTVSHVTASWLNSSFCPGTFMTCTGFQPINYQIFTSPDGTQNSWGTACATVTANASFTTSDACSASGVRYIEFLITSWNASTPFGGFGPALNSLLVT
jgi:hypothetical protein